MSGAKSRNWIAVASAEHVARGRAGGFMQVCHGKEGPLRRLQPGDYVLYYSPTEVFGGKTRLQAFTAIGTVAAGRPYAFDMGGGFVPFRRDVQWLSAQQQPIHPLLAQLEFTRDDRHWGARLRHGLVAISVHDLHRIATAMSVDLETQNELVASCNSESNSSAGMGSANRNP